MQTTNQVENRELLVIASITISEYVYYFRCFLKFYLQEDLILLEMYRFSDCLSGQTNYP